MTFDEYSGGYLKEAGANRFKLVTITWTTKRKVAKMHSRTFTFWAKAIVIAFAIVSYSQVPSLAAMSPNSELGNNQVALLPDSLQAEKFLSRSVVIPINDGDIRIFALKLTNQELLIVFFKVGGLLPTSEATLYTLDSQVATGLGASKYGNVIATGSSGCVEFNAMRSAAHLDKVGHRKGEWFGRNGHSAHPDFSIFNDKAVAIVMRTGKSIEVDEDTHLRLSMIFPGETERRYAIVPIAE